MGNGLIIIYNKTKNTNFNIYTSHIIYYFMCTLHHVLCSPQGADESYFCHPNNNFIVKG